MTNQEKYDQKQKRINDAVSLTEPDTVPFCPIVQCYPFLQAGYSMADILYDSDVSKAKKSLLQFLDTYDPDALMGHAYVNIGMGPIFEKTKPKTVRWAGMPGDVIDKNSIHQFLEFPVLEDDEFDLFMSDRSGWTLNKGFPKTSELLEPFAGFNPASMDVFNGATMVAPAVSSPEFKAMMQTLWEINDMNSDLQAKMRRLDVDVEAYGYPVNAQGFAAVPFDSYSDFLRGTLNGLADIYERPDIVKAYCDEQLQVNLDMIKAEGQMLPGRHVFMALHKGMDGFMSDSCYREYYWDYLRTIIGAIIDAGMVPYIYTEGKYNSRLECLREVPKGKVIYHFEDVDMAEAKRILGDTACIAGGFPVYLLDYGTKEQVVDEVKRLIDVCAPGGGFIFETSCGMDYAKPENVEAMMDTVRTYGKR